MSMQKAKVIDQKEYLKKYLSGDKERRRRKRRRRSTKRIRPTPK